MCEVLLAFCLPGGGAKRKSTWKRTLKVNFMVAVEQLDCYSTALVDYLYVDEVLQEGVEDVMFGEVVLKWWRLTRACWNTFIGTLYGHGPSR